MSALSTSSMSTTSGFSTKCLAKRSKANVLTDIAHIAVAKPAIMEPLNGIVDVQTFLERDSCF